MNNNPTLPSKPNLLEQVRQQNRLKNYSIRTENAHVQWIRQYINFHELRHPQQMGTSEIKAFIRKEKLGVFAAGMMKSVRHLDETMAIASTTMIYTHVMHKRTGGIRSALTNHALPQIHHSPFRPLSAIIPLYSNLRLSGF